MTQRDSRYENAKGEWKDSDWFATKRQLRYLRYLLYIMAPGSMTMDKKVVSYSQMSDFLSCRRKWLWRQAYRPLVQPDKLLIGSLFHKGLEGADLEHEARELEATPEQLELVKDMLAYFEEWKIHHPQPKILEHELEFEVELAPDVLLAGRVDAIGEYDGEMWVIEHKTCGTFASEESWLFSDQIPGYIIGARKKTGEPIAGVMLYEHKRQVPESHLRELKSGKLSLDVRQQITAYRAEQDIWIRNNGADPTEDQREFLGKLRSQENENGDRWIRRTRIIKSEVELQSYRARATKIAREMTKDDLEIYASPSRLCAGCIYRAPCLAAETGGDAESILESEYRRMRANGIPPELAEYREVNV